MMVAVLAFRLLVALRKESVDRNVRCHCWGLNEKWSLSARRAWIEIGIVVPPKADNAKSLSARRAWIEIVTANVDGFYWWGRSPQGERG